MVDAAPFRALRYNVEVAGDPATTSAPAYDDLGAFTYARHRTISPYTVLELLAPGVGAPDDYTASGAAFRRWQRTGVLLQETRPAFYLYEEHELRHGVPAVQRGLLAAVSVTDAAVHAHEDVDPQRVADRVARLRAAPVDVAPVFAVYPSGPGALRDLLRRPPRRAPLVAVSDESGIDHRIWRLDEPGEVAHIRQALRDVDVVIADGHHRFAAARALADHDGRTLMYLVDATDAGPQILPVHRLLRAVGAQILQALPAEVEAFPAPSEPAALAAALAGHAGRAWGLHLCDGTAHLLAVRDEDALQRRLPDRSRAWRSLDVAVFEHAILPTLGAHRVDYRPDHGGAAGEVAASVEDALVVFRPVGIEAVYACAVGGEPMPAKTTWFRPKPRAGLVMRSLHSA